MPQTPSHLSVRSTKRGCLLFKLFELSLIFPLEPDGIVIIVLIIFLFDHVRMPSQISDFSVVRNSERECQFG